MSPTGNAGIITLGQMLAVKLVELGVGLILIPISTLHVFLTARSTMWSKEVFS